MSTKKKTRKHHSKDLLKTAIDQVVNKKFLTNNVADSMNIPRATLRRHVKLAKDRGLPTLQPPEEGTLQEIIMNLCSTFYWIAATKFKQLLFEHKVRKLTEFKKFVKTHDCFTIFKCQHYFYNRTLQELTTNYTLSETKAFFDDFAETLDNLHIAPGDIYDVDAISIGVIKTNSSSSMHLKGKNYCIDEFAPKLVVLNSANAQGRFVPPFFVANRKETRKFINDLEPGMVACVTSANRLTAKMFIEWLHHFNDFAKPSSHKPVLLIVDNSMWHVSISAYQYCQKHFIKLHVLPPHTAKRMHPLEQSLNKLLKKACQEEASRYLLDNPKTKITTHDLVRFYIKSFNKVNEAHLCAMGFVSCGIYPPDQVKFRVTFRQDTKPLDESDPCYEENLLNIHETQAGVLKINYENFGIRDKGPAVFVKPDFIRFSSSSNKNVATTVSQLLLSMTCGLPVSHVLNQSVPVPVPTQKLVPKIFFKHDKNFAVNVNQETSNVSVTLKRSTTHNNCAGQCSSDNLEDSGQVRGLKIKVTKTPNKAYSKRSQPHSTTAKSKKSKRENDKTSETPEDSFRVMNSKEAQTDSSPFQINVLPSISISPDRGIDLPEPEDKPNQLLNIKLENTDYRKYGHFFVTHEEIDLPVDIIKTEEVDLLADIIKTEEDDFED